MSPRSFDDVKILSVYSDDTHEPELPDPSIITVEKEVTGLLEYSLFYMSHYTKQQAHGCVYSLTSFPLVGNLCLTTCLAQ